MVSGLSGGYRPSRQTRRRFTACGPGQAAGPNRDDAPERGRDPAVDAVRRRSGNRQPARWVSERHQRRRRAPWETGAGSASAGAGPIRPAAGRQMRSPHRSTAMRRRTLVGVTDAASSGISRRTRGSSAERVLADLLDDMDPDEVERIVAALDLLDRRLTDRALARWGGARRRRAAQAGPRP